MKSLTRAMIATKRTSMKQKLTFFNDLLIGAVAAHGDTRFVKFADAGRYKNLHDQMPNALNLDNSHYLSVQKPRAL